MNRSGGEVQSLKPHVPRGSGDEPMQKQEEGAR